MLLAILIALVILNKILYKSYLNPIFLQSVLWLVYYLFLMLKIDLYDLYLNNLNQFVFYQSIGFSLGGFVCTLFTRRKMIYERLPFDEKQVERTHQNLLMLYPVILGVLLITTFFLTRQTSSFSIFSFADLKQDLVEDDGKKSGLFGLVQLISSVYVTVFIVTKDAVKKNLMKFLILLPVFFFFTLLLGSKGQFLFFFCSTLYIFAWKRQVKIYQILFFGALLVGLMLLVTFLRLGGENGVITADLLSDALLIYTITPLPGLHLFHPAHPALFGYYTFRVAYVWLNKFGFDFPISPMLFEFTQTPYPSNVYSYINPYYQDFGYIGVFLIPFFLGIVHNIFYYRSNRGKLSSMLFSAFFMYPLCMQFFEENYLRQFTNWVYVFLLILVLTQGNFSRKRQTHLHLQPTA